jgi:hypothetical protein
MTKALMLIYETYVLECQDAGGVLYLSGNHIRWINSGKGSIDILRRNTPHCYVSQLSSCKDMLANVVTYIAIYEVNFTESGYTCVYLESTHELEPEQRDYDNAFVYLLIHYKLTI